MNSPLETFNKVMEDFKITPDKQLHPRQKIAFYEEQANQQKQIINRLIGDLAKAKFDSDSAKDDTAKDAFDAQVNKYTNDLRQLLKSVDFFSSLAEGLKKENPDVQAVRADIPESQ